MVTEDKLKAILSEHLKVQKEELIKEFKKEINALAVKVETIKKTADDALTLAKQNEENIKRIDAEVKLLTTQYGTLKTDNDNLKTSSDAKDLTIKSLESKLEDSTNRHMRKTLVIKGVKELDNETWKMTESVLAKTISQATDGDVEESEAANMIERAHRSKPNRQKKGRRDIFVKFYSWKDSEYVKEQFARKNIKDRKFKTYCEQKYGPLTTARRNEALKARKELKSSGEITRGFVAFPAKLMVKLPDDSRDAKYRVHKDYSNIEISQDMLARHHEDAGAEEAS